MRPLEWVALASAIIMAAALAAAWDSYATSRIQAQIQEQMK